MRAVTTMVPALFASKNQLVIYKRKGELFINEKGQSPHT